jgi:hypothetical protein
MQELLEFAEKYGPWLVIFIYTAYKFVPVAAEKLIPDWVSNRHAAQKAERETVISVYERFIAQNAQTISFISSATEALHSFVRSLDANTQQVFHMTKTVERGPSCPLPDCPYWESKENSP